MSYIVNGEQYETEDKIPDFGSIKLQENTIRCQFDDKDRDKLDLLTRAGEGSLAYCTDKKYWLTKHNGKWVEA